MRRKKTYDVVFSDDTTLDAKGFSESKAYCIEYVKRFNGTNESYFEDYKGGTAFVVCNETHEVAYFEEIR